MDKAIIYYYIVINIIAFAAYFIDKRKAVKHSYRISEATLLGLCLMGGGLGALMGMQVFRHKTKKLAFQILVPASILLHLYLIYKYF